MRAAAYSVCHLVQQCTRSGGRNSGSQTFSPWSGALTALVPPTARGASSNAGKASSQSLSQQQRRRRQEKSDAKQRRGRTYGADWQSAPASEELAGWVLGAAPTRAPAPAPTRAPEKTARRGAKKGQQGRCRGDKGRKPRGQRGNRPRSATPLHHQIPEAKETRAIRMCEQRGDWAGALRLLEEAHAEHAADSTARAGLTALTYDAVLGSCADHARWREAGALLGRMNQRDVAPSQRTYTNLIRACGNAGQWQQSLSLLAFLEQQEEQQQVQERVACAETGGQGYVPFPVPAGLPHYTECIKACSRAAEWELALELLERMSARGIAPTLLCYNSAAEACKRGGAWEDAVGLLRRMQARAGAAKEAQESKSGAAVGATTVTAPPPAAIAPNHVTYAAAIGACHAAGKTELAEQLMGDMAERGIYLSDAAMSSAIAAYGADGRWKDALALLARMVHGGARPKLVCYNAAITACGRNGEWERAVGLLEAMAKRGMALDVVTFNAGIAACREGGHWKKALELFAAMEEQGLTPNQVSYGSAIAVCGRGGAWQEGLRLLVQMKTRGIEPSTITYNSAISACNRGSGDAPRRALEVLQEMRLPGCTAVVDIITLSAAIIACQSLGDWQTALKLLDEIDARDIGPARVTTYNSALSACEQHGRWEEALALLGAMQRHDVWLNESTFSIAIWACARGGQWREATRLLDEMFRHGFSAGTKTYNAVLHACEGAGEWEEALLLLDEMTGRGVELDEHSAYMIILTCARAGRWGEAMALCQELPMQRGVPVGTVAYAETIVALRAANQHAEAAWLFRRAAWHGSFKAVMMRGDRYDGIGGALASSSTAGDVARDFRVCDAHVACAALQCLLEELRGAGGAEARQLDGDVFLVLGSDGGGGERLSTRAPADEERDVIMPVGAEVKALLESVGLPHEEGLYDGARSLVLRRHEVDIWLSSQVAVDLEPSQLQEPPRPPQRRQSKCPASPLPERPAVSRVISLLDTHVANVSRSFGRFF